MLIFCCFFFHQKIPRFITNGIISCANSFSRSFSVIWELNFNVLCICVSLSLYLCGCVCVSADTSVDVVVVVYNCCRDFVLGPSFPHRFIGQANFGFNFMKQFVDHLICLCWNQLQNRKKTHEFMIKTNFTHRTVIAALTDFTVVFINSFLCVRSKSGYFE